MAYNNNFPILIIIHITHRLHFRILPTRHIITLTNLVCRIGLIRINITHVLNFITIISRIILTLYRVSGDSPPLSPIFNQLVLLIHLVHNFTIFIPRFCFYTSFLEQPIEEKFELEKSIEDMQEAERKFQASPISQYFQDSYSVLPIQNRKPSILEMSMRESEQQSQNLMDLRFHHKF